MPVLESLMPESKMQLPLWCLFFIERTNNLKHYIWMIKL